MQDGLSLRIDDVIAELQLQREAQHNAFDEALHRAFCLALRELRQRTDLRVIVLHAAGSRFSAGGGFGYIEQLRDDPVLRERTHHEAHEIFSSLLDMPMPVVVAMQGDAIGFGATIVTACDVSVAWRGARLGDPHVRIGLAAGDGGVLSWTAAAGFNRARRMLLTGDTMSAEQAYAAGLLTDLVDTADAALPEARRIAQQIAGLPPLAVQGTKRAFNALARQQNGEVLDASLRAEMDCFSSEDLSEALQALREKRAGRYQNR